MDASSPPTSRYCEEHESFIAAAVTPMAGEFWTTKYMLGAAATATAAELEQLYQSSVAGHQHKQSRVHPSSWS